MLYRSAFNPLLQYILSLALIIQCARLCLHASQYPFLKELVWAGGRWQLLDKKGAVKSYQKHRVTMDTGVFFLLQLQEESEKRSLLIFFDQLSGEDYRTLRVLEMVV